MANKYYIKSLCIYELRNFQHALNDLNIAEFYFKNCILILNESKKRDLNYFDSDSEEFIYLYYLQGLCNYELENFEEAINLKTLLLEKNNNYYWFCRFEI